MKIHDERWVRIPVIDRWQKSSHIEDFILLARYRGSVFIVHHPSCTFCCYTPHGFICFFQVPLSSWKCSAGLKSNYSLHVFLKALSVIGFQMDVEKDYFSWIKNMVYCIVHDTLKSNGCTKNSKATICCFEININICRYWQALMFFTWFLFKILKKWRGMFAYVS